MIRLLRITLVFKLMIKYQVSLDEGGEVVVSICFLNLCAFVYELYYSIIYYDYIIRLHHQNYLCH